MTTYWTTPSTVTQYAEDPSHIEWNQNFNSLTSVTDGVSLNKPLQHISRQPKNDIKMKTWYLQATNFNFQNLPTTVSGISFRFSVYRGGRIFDETIQLTYINELIGENKCLRTVDPVQIYGGVTDTWTVENLDSIVRDPTFGIVIRLRSHPDWPHKTTPILRGLELQIH